MFAEALAESRARAGVSVARLAELAGTSRAAISDYEACDKSPRVDTAERVLRSLGKQLVALDQAGPFPAHVSADVIAPLEAWAPDPERAIAAARRDLAVIVDSDANVERLDVSWGQVKTLVGGTTIDGDPWSVWRVHELHEDARAALHLIESGTEPQLRVVAQNTLIETGPTAAGPVRTAIEFLIRATGLGADPAHVRHLAGSYLAFHGYPWLWVPHALADDYRCSLVAVRRGGNGTAMVRVLMASLEKVNWDG